MLYYGMMRVELPPVLWRVGLRSVCAFWLMMSVLVLAAVACSDDTETVSEPFGEMPESEAEGGTTGDGSEGQERLKGQDSEVLQEIAATGRRLRENAEAFSYAVSKRAGSRSLGVALTSELSTFNPALVDDAATAGMLQHIFEGLVRESWLTGEPEPALAESWEVSDDGLKWTFRLREDVRWHDGEPFTAEDVVFTFNQIIYNDDIPTAIRTSFEFASPGDDSALPSRKARMTVEALGNYTVEFTLPTPFAPFLRLLSTVIYPEHILVNHVIDGTFTEVWGVDASPTDIVGTGPFSVAFYTPGRRLILTRNPYYWLKDQAGESLPYLNEVVFLIKPSSSDALNAFLSGDVHLGYVRGEDFSRLDILQQDGYFTIHKLGPGFGTHYLAFNMNPGLRHRHRSELPGSG